MKALVRITFFFFLVQNASVAQFGETIRTGRPGQSIGTFCLGGNTFQMQSGYTYFGEDDFKNNQFTNILRYGIGERWEASAVVNFQSVSILDEATQGFNSLQIGGRYHLMDQNGWLPGMCIQSRVALPIDNIDIEMEDIGLNSILAMGWGINQYLSTVVNLGNSWNISEGDMSYRYTWALNIQPIDRWTILLEIFGSFDEDPLYDFGVGYLVNPNLQLDVSLGRATLGVSDFVFYDIGFSWRTNWREKHNLSWQKN